MCLQLLRRQGWIWILVWLVSPVSSQLPRHQCQQCGYLVLCSDSDLWGGAQESALSNIQAKLMQVTQVLCVQKHCLTQWSWGAWIRKSRSLFLKLCCTSAQKLVESKPRFHSASASQKQGREESRHYIVNTAQYSESCWSLKTSGVSLPASDFLSPSMLDASVGDWVS